MECKLIKKEIDLKKYHVLNVEVHYSLVKDKVSEVWFNKTATKTNMWSQIFLFDDPKNIPGLLKGS